MARIAFLLAVLFAWSVPALAKPTPIEPPVTNRPIDFSNIVGKYAIRATAEPVDVHLEEPITLKIYITGEGPKKYEPSRKHLQLFPSYWESDFYVQELRDEHQVLNDKKTWLFVYRLKPKHLKVKTIDDIKLVYYDPAAKEFTPYYADAIAITVKPKAAPDPIVVPFGAAPDSFYEVLDSREVLMRSTHSFTPTLEQVFLFLALPPLVCLIAAFAWRRCFPDGATRAHRYRNAAAQRGVVNLQGEGACAWDIVCQYLHERFAFRVADPTPAEVAAFLKGRGFARDLCEHGRVFFQVCDAERYTSARQEPRQLADAAVRLIQALEADPCVRS